MVSRLALLAVICRSQSSSLCLVGLQLASARNVAATRSTAMRAGRTRALLCASASRARASYVVRADDGGAHDAVVGALPRNKQATDWRRPLLSTNRTVRLTRVVPSYGATYGVRRTFVQRVHVSRPQAWRASCSSCADAAKHATSIFITNNISHKQQQRDHFTTDDSKSTRADPQHMLNIVLPRCQLHLKSRTSTIQSAVRCRASTNQ